MEKVVKTAATATQGKVGNWAKSDQAIVNPVRKEIFYTTERKHEHCDCSDPAPSCQ